MENTAQSSRVMPFGKEKWLINDQTCNSQQNTFCVPEIVSESRSLHKDIGNLSSLDCFAQKEKSRTNRREQGVFFFL